MVIRLRKLKRQNFWVSLLITNCFGRTMWFMSLAKYQEDWQWLSKLGFIWIKGIDHSILFICIPYLSYCIHIWGNIYQSNLRQLCVTQNKIMRVIACVKPRESAMPLYESLGIMKINDINKYLIARLMYKYCVGMIPHIFSSYFVRNYDVSSNDLRSSNCFYLPIVTSDLGKNGVRYRGPVLLINF